jgi:hypothetical protein
MVPVNLPVFAMHGFGGQLHFVDLGSAASP